MLQLPDLEKVINIYANCILNDKQCCSGCYTGGPGLGIACRQKVLTDAFYLLKEQDELLKHEYWRGYNNGRADERGLQEGTIMQTFSPD